MRYACCLAALAGIFSGGCAIWDSPGAPDQDVSLEHFVSAQLLMDEGKTDEALAELELATEADPDMAVAHAAIGEIHYSREQFTLAAEAYGEAVRANPFNLDFAERLAACYDRLGQAEKAERIRDRTAAGKPAP